MTIVVNQNLKSGEAGADLTGKKGFAVKRDTAGLIVLSGANETSVGTLSTEGISGATISYARVGGDFAGVAGATFDAGVELKSDASGKYIAATTAADFVIAISNEPATAVDHVVSITLTNYQKHA